MRYSLSIVVFVVFLSVGALQGCAQENKQNYYKTDMEITDHYKNYKYLNKSRPGYYLQINHQNCHYDLEVNGFNSGKYFDEYPSYSIRRQLNLRILKSGEQKLKVKVLPFKGDTLSKNAHLELRLIRYPDMTDIENAYGGATVLWEWKMPQIGQKLPLYAMDTVFNAEVPYQIDVLDLYAQDLSKMDKEELLAEVVTELKTSAIVSSMVLKIESTY